MEAENEPSKSNETVVEGSIIKENKRTVEDCEKEDHDERKKLKVDDGSETDTLVGHDGNGETINEPAEAGTKQLLKQAENGGDLQVNVEQEVRNLTQTVCFLIKWL